MEFAGFTDKQREIIKRGYAKLVILQGAVRSGKTYLTYFFIPDLIKRLREGKGIILGKTLATVNENVIEPMRSLFGDNLISSIKTDASGKKYCRMFGVDVRCVGATDKKAVDKIRGATYAWAIADEVATWDENTFSMLMSRLSEKGSVCICTANPEEPTHWFNQKYIMKDDIDKLVYTFSIDDNPKLDSAYVENLKNLYRGTVLYDRLIIGLWASGSGAIYKRFITEPDNYIIEDTPENIEALQKDLMDYAIGVDFGENVSATTFKLVGLRRGYKGIVLLEEEHIKEHKDTKLLQEQFLSFCKKCLTNGWKIRQCYYDCAQKTLGESLRSAVLMSGLPCLVNPCIKDEINERINQEIVLFGGYRLQMLKHCEWGIKAFREAVYEENTEKRLDVVSPDNPIDDLDAFEYAYQNWSNILMEKAYYSI